MVTSGGLPYAAWLRVYEPLTAFADAEREYWTSYLAAPGRPDRLELLVREQQAAIRRAIALPVQVGPLEHLRGAFVLDSADSGQDEPLICPLDERLRSWQALESLLDEIPEPLLSSFVPAGVAADALEAYTSWRRERTAESAGGVSPHVLTSTWHVPLWWFVAFAPQERLVTLEPASERALLYRTPMHLARTRMAQGLDVLRRSMGEGSATEGVEEVARWLEEFHPHSFVELDYGGLAWLVDIETLQADVSAEDVVIGLAALQAGEPDGAQAAYTRLIERWREVQALEHAT